MTKVHGKRYAYKFDFRGLYQACQHQAQGGDPTANMISAASYKYLPQHDMSPSAISMPYSPTSSSPSTSFSQSTAGLSGVPTQLSPPSTSTHTILKPSAGPPLFVQSPYWPYSPPTFDHRSSNSFN